MNSIKDDVVLYCISMDARGQLHGASGNYLNPTS